MSYVVLTVISSMFFAFYDLFKKISVRKGKDIYEILFFYTLIAFLCGFIFVKDAFMLSFTDVMFLFLKSAIVSLSWILTMKAMSKLDIGIVVPFSLLAAVFTSFNAAIFYGEDIGLVQIGGIIVILLGLILLSKLSNHDKRETNDYKFLWLLVLASFLTSLAAMLDKKLASNISSGAVAFWFFLFLSVIYMTICLFRNKKIDFKNFKTNLWVVLIGISIFLSDIFYYYALAIDNTMISVVFIFKRLSVFMSVVLASIFLKEKYFLKKLIILMFMFCGLGLILFL